MNQLNFKAPNFYPNCLPNFKKLPCKINGIPYVPPNIIKRPIGSGTFGTVYKAYKLNENHCIDVSKNLAIKFFDDWTKDKMNECIVTWTVYQDIINRYPLYLQNQSWYQSFLYQYQYHHSIQIPTVKLYDYECKPIIHGVIGNALVMDYYPNRDLEHWR